MREFRKRLRIKSEENVEKAALKATRWIGSTASLITHTLLFVGSFLLYFFGFELDKILLVVTTIVSLEAIYLSIFIQMSVNRHSNQLEEVAQDVEEIQEDVEEIQEDVEGIEKDVEEIQEDVEGIEKDVEDIQEDVEEITEEEDTTDVQDTKMLNRIEETLGKLMEEVAELKKIHKKD